MKPFLTFALVFLHLLGFSQARLVLNGGIVNIENGAYLVLDNPNGNAITRLVGGGHIISESENDVVRWNIGQTADTYNIPWGIGASTYLPMSFTTVNNAVGINGFMDFATYRTPTWKNSDFLPSGVLHVGGMGDAPGLDISNYVIDRFWLMGMRSYTTKPSLTSVQFNYQDIEHSVASNTITESDLVAQRYNDIIEDWGPVFFGSANTALNNVTAPSIANNQIYDWWTLAMSTFPLPIELLVFTGFPVEDQVKLVWETSTEFNNDYYVVERSKDGQNFEFVSTVDAIGFSNNVTPYFTFDPKPYKGISYYRLKQVDLDGRFTYSKVIDVEFGEENNLPLVQIYPNPTNNYLQVAYNSADAPKVFFQMFDATGRLVMENKLDVMLGSGRFSLDVSRLAQGSYFLNFKGLKGANETYQFVKQ